MFRANKKKFSFRWIEKQFVRVHPGENVSESGGKCFKRWSRICRSERDVKLDVISVQMIFEGIL